jgi:RNA polymerase sigma-70 factor (ECF subfamily)
MSQPQLFERLSDAALVDRARTGCASSFDELMARHQAPLRHFLRVRASAAECDDLLQETFLRALRRLETYHDRFPVRAWLFAIARRTAADFGRRPRPASLERAEDVRGAEREPHEAVGDEDQRCRLWSEAKRILAEAEWTALWLHYVEQLPIGEVAEVIGRSRTATKTMIFRARRELAAELRSLDPRREPSPRPRQAI